MDFKLARKPRETKKEQTKLKQQQDKQNLA